MPNDSKLRRIGDAKHGDDTLILYVDDESGLPTVVSCMTGNAWTVSWVDLVSMAISAGISIPSAARH